MFFYLATDHIACSIDSFDDYHDVHRAEVNLPTGSCIEVKHIGSIDLSSGLKLKNVLHIPSFRFNIISVRRLLQDDCHKLMFFSGQCVIQDTHGRKIGIAKEENGLYILMQSIQSAVHNNRAIHCNNGDLWHQRLGHFPFNKLHLLDDIGVSNTKVTACDICHLAKHKRSPFPLSITSSKACFELLHMDIWGPFSIPTLQGEQYFLTLVDDYSRFTWLHLIKNCILLKTNQSLGSSLRSFMPWYLLSLAP